MNMMKCGYILNNIVKFVDHSTKTVVQIYFVLDTKNKGEIYLKSEW